MALFHCLNIVIKPHGLPHEYGVKENYIHILLLFDHFISILAFRLLRMVTKIITAKQAGLFYLIIKMDKHH